VPENITATVEANKGSTPCEQQEGRDDQP